MSGDHYRDTSSRLTLSNSRVDHAIRTAHRLILKGARREDYQDHTPVARSNVASRFVRYFGSGRLGVARVAEVENEEDVSSDRNKRSTIASICRTYL